MIELTNYNHKLIDGRKLSQTLYSSISESVKRSNVQPHLAIILASEDESSKTYVRLKKERAEKLGMKVSLFEFNTSVSAEELFSVIDVLNADESISGMLIQLPLHEHLLSSRDEILNRVHEQKDVDGLTAKQLGNSIHFLKHAILPATVEAVLECLNECTEETITWKSMLEHHDIIQFFKGKKVCIVNNSNMIGKPLAMVLSNLGATVIIMNEFSPDLSECTMQSDIIVSATGQTQLINHIMIKEGAILIDVTSVFNGDRTVGDFVLSDELLKKCSYITPVPGGVGPLTVACLLRNVMNATK